MSPPCEREPPTALAAAPCHRPHTDVSGDDPATYQYRDRAHTRTEKGAATLKPDDLFERLLDMPDAEREAMLAKAPSVRWPLGSYRAAKTADEVLAKEQSR